MLSSTRTLWLFIVPALVLVLTYAAWSRRTASVERAEWVAALAARDAELARALEQRKTAERLLDDSERRGLFFLDKLRELEDERRYRPLEGAATAHAARVDGALRSLDERSTAIAESLEGLGARLDGLGKALQSLSSLSEDVQKALGAYSELSSAVGATREGLEKVRTDLAAGLAKTQEETLAALAKSSEESRAASASEIAQALVTPIERLSAVESSLTRLEALLAALEAKSVEAEPSVDPNAEALAAIGNQLEALHASWSSLDERLARLEERSESKDPVSERREPEASSVAEAAPSADPPMGALGATIATVRVLDAARGVLVFDAGGDAGLRNGDELDVHRGGERVARVRVLRVEARHSGARVFWRAPGASIEVGDGVSPIANSGASSENPVTGAPENGTSTAESDPKRPSGASSLDRLGEEKKVPPPPPGS